MKAAALLQDFNAKWTLQKTMLPDSFGQHTKGYNTSLSPCCTPHNFTLFFFILHECLAPSHFDPACFLSLWNETWCERVVARRVCAWALKNWGTCPVRFPFKSHLPALPLMSVTLLHHSKGAADFCRQEGCACDVFVLFRERETETRRGRLKTERKHSPALASH